MKCPVCKSKKLQEIDLHADGFYEGIFECEICSDQPPQLVEIELIRDPQPDSFLQGMPEKVESDDYNQVG